MKIFAQIFLMCCCACSWASVLGELAQAAKTGGATAMDIELEKKMAFFEEPAKSKMRVAVSDSGAMRMQTDSPFEAMSVFDGSRFARFEREGGQWRRLDSADSPVARGIFAQMFGLFTGSISGADYKIAESGDAAELVPQSAAVRKAVAKIRIFTRKAGGARVVEKIVIDDADGDSSVLKISNVRKIKPDGGFFDAASPSPWERGK